MIKQELWVDKTWIVVCQLQINEKVHGAEMSNLFKFSYADNLFLQSGQTNIPVG